MTRISQTVQPRVQQTPPLPSIGDLARKAPTGSKAQAPVVTASPTLLYTDVNGTLAELVAGSAKSIPAVKNLLNKSPQLSAAMLNVASSRLGKAIRWELGFATDGDGTVADLRKPSNYSLILKFSPPSPNSSADFGRFTSSLEPVIGKQGVSRFRAALNAVRGKASSDVRIYVAPRTDGGVDLSLGVSTVVVPTRTIGTAPRRVGTAESVPHRYGLAQIITRVPLNNVDSRPGAQVVVALGGGKQGKQYGVELAGAKVFSYKNNNGSLGFVQKNGEFGVVVPQNGKQYFVSLGKDGSPITALTGISATSVPQSSLPTLGREQIAKEISQTIPRSAQEKAQQIIAAADAAGPYMSFATAIAPYVAFALCPNPVTGITAGLDAAARVHDTYQGVQDADKKLVASWADSVKAKNFEGIYKAFFSSPYEQKPNIIRRFADQVEAQIKSGKLDRNSTYAAWKRIADSGYSGAAGDTPVQWDSFPDGQFHMRKTIQMREFVEPLARAIVYGNVNKQAAEGTVERELSIMGISTEPLRPASKAAGSDSRVSATKVNAGQAATTYTVAGEAMQGTASAIQRVTARTPGRDYVEGTLMFGRNTAGQARYWLKGTDTNYKLRTPDGQPAINLPDAQAAVQRLIEGGGATRLRKVSSDVDR